MKTIDAEVAKEYVAANYTNDPLLKHIITEALDKLPKVEAAPVVHGNWFFTEYEYFDCSECGFVYCNGCECTSEAREMLRNGDAYKYCPNCGAKMDGGEANELQAL